MTDEWTADDAARNPMMPAPDLFIRDADGQWHPHPDNARDFTTDEDGWTIDPDSPEGQRIIAGMERGA